MRTNEPTSAPRSSGPVAGSFVIPPLSVAGRVLSRSRATHVPSARPGLNQAFTPNGSAEQYADSIVFPAKPETHPAEFGKIAGNRRHPASMLTLLHRAPGRLLPISSIRPRNSRFTLSTGRTRARLGAAHSRPDFMPDIWAPVPAPVLCPYLARPGGRRTGSDLARCTSAGLRQGRGPLSPARAVIQCLRAPLIRQQTASCKARKETSGTWDGPAAISQAAPQGPNGRAVALRHSPGAQGRPGGG